MLTLQTIILAAYFITQSPAEPQFQIIETEASTFKLCKLELTNLQQEGIVFGVECIQKTYEDLFGFTFPENFKVKVVLFKEKEDYLSYQRKATGKVVSESGYFSPRDAEAVTWLQDGFQQMVAVLFHEANHMLLMHQVPWCPDWINEGLSEYFESLNLFDGDRCICIQKNKLEWCKYWLKNDNFPIGFEPFFKLKNDDWDGFNKENNYAGYTLGYSLVYFLMTNTKTKDILKEILWDLKQNKYDADSVATINKFYPGGIKKLEVHWKRWIPRARPRKPLKALIEKTKEKQQDDSTTESKKAE